MKHWKVSRKLIVSFLIVAVLALVVGGAGIGGFLWLDQQMEIIYANQMIPMTDLSQLTTLLQRMRVGMREYTIGISQNDNAKIREAKTTIDELNAQMTQHFDAFAPTITNEQARALFNEARGLFDGNYQTFLEESYQAAVDGNLEVSLRILDEARPDTTTIVDNLDQVTEIRLGVAGGIYGNAKTVSEILLVFIIILLVLAAGSAIFFAFYISGMISTPLSQLTTFLKKAGSSGDLRLDPADIETIEKYAQNRDDMGQCISGAASFIAHVNKISELLEIISDGNLGIDVALLSDSDTMGKSMKKVVDNLNHMFGNIQSTTAQVSAEAKQIANGAQALAQGATQQAAAVQELSSSIAEISVKTKTNADMAHQTALLANTIKDSAEKGTQQMDEMMSAVNEINQASQSISKVIKTIDDIAFQTNILALNAAVEAARAGQHGKGFAVVAEEVRNLAAKSAEAAKDTESLIANSMDKAELGARIAGETASSLSEIVAGINESSSMIRDIAQSSEEQSAGIEQINTGIDQVAQVVQQNSATAEESAAASEEMSGQSDILEELISQFKLKESYSGRPSSSAHEKRSMGNPNPIPARQATHYADSDAFGDSGDKY